jgi:hypothetical protein
MGNSAQTTPNTLGSNVDGDGPDIRTPLLHTNTPLPPYYQKRLIIGACAATAPLALASAGAFGIAGYEYMQIDDPNDLIAIAEDAAGPAIAGGAFALGALGGAEACMKLYRSRSR